MFSPHLGIGASLLCSQMVTWLEIVFKFNGRGRVEWERFGNEVCGTGGHSDGKFLNLTSVLPARTWDPGTLVLGSLLHIHPVYKSPLDTHM